MPKQKNIIQNKMDEYPLKKRDFSLLSTHLEVSLDLLEQEHQTKLAELAKTYEKKELETLDEYMRIEEAYAKAVTYIRDRYEEEFKAFQEEQTQLDASLQLAEGKETKTYSDVISSILDMKNEAYQRFLDMVESSDNAIDDEMRVHHEFIAEEDRKKSEKQVAYQQLLSEQADHLLWSIEESKNALVDLRQTLTEQSKNATSFMNDNILETLNQLRSTKQKISGLFKNTTERYQTQIEKINQLSHQRQQPHSQINQTVIRQYVKQIKDVNQKKIHFERLILKELETSKATIGARIIEADRQNDPKLLEKTIMQYEIIQAKADYLLKRNQSMADLLISKYQNEIKKIKIDSFKRVEEIRLAYFMPTTFFQNSVNLYSNFSFYVNDSFDELDNLLSDLILFNKSFGESMVDYIHGDAKVMEDYRIGLMGRVNNVTQNLADMIQQIDAYSRDIVTLESRNHLEIAEMRKRMENAEIQGDYDKYLASLEQDHYFADRTHDDNLKRSLYAFEKEAAYLRIQREIATLRQNHDLFVSRTSYLKEIARLEEQIHRIAYDKDLDFSRLRFENMKQQNDIQFEIASATMRHHADKLQALYASRYRDQTRLQFEKQKDGSDEVVEYIHHAQSLIDMSKVQTEQIVSTLSASKGMNQYSRHLLEMRNRICDEVLHQSEQKTRINRQACDLIHHEFYVTKLEIDSLFDQFLSTYKHRLLMLSEQTVSVLVEYFQQRNMFVPDWMNATDEILRLVKDLLLPFQRLDRYPFIEENLHHSFESFVGDAVVFLENGLPKSERKQRMLLDDFLSKSILRFSKLQSTLQEELDDLEKQLLEADVLYLHRASQQAQRTIQVVQREYDRMIFRSTLRRSERDKLNQHLVNEARSVEESLKSRVKEINQIYESSVTTEQKALGFIKQEIEKLILEVEKKFEKDLSHLEKAYHKQQLSIDLEIREYDKAHRSLTSRLSELKQHDISIIEKMGSEEMKQWQASLQVLDQEAIQIPNTYSESIAKLESAKLQMIEEKKAELMRTYTEIEEMKFSARPTYLLEIDRIKERLPEDYKALYQQISMAEDEFLSKYTQISADYTLDFQEFLVRQKEARKLLSDHPTMDHPFDQFIDLETSLDQKNVEAFDTTVEKAKATSNRIAFEETKTKEKQNRIIND